MSATEVREAPVSRARPVLSLIWLLPLLAALIGIVLVVRHAMNTGPEIAIQFNSAEGLIAGKTEVRYKEFAVGRVTNINLIEGASKVSVDVRLDKDADAFTAADARYWVTRPQVGVGGISGLGTLVSGAYISVDRGVSDEVSNEFVGLELPPLVMRGDAGRTVRLSAQDLGSLDIGSPVYYRKLKAGRVVGYRLRPDGQSIDLSLFIDSPYDQLVTTDTRFWNASGLNLSVDASGVQINTQSLLTLIVGGISFGLLESGKSESAVRVAAPEDAVFQLFEKEDEAFETPGGPARSLQMEFANTVRGLSQGAPVEFLGLGIGSVTAINLRYEPQGHEFKTLVDATIYPSRLGDVQAEFARAFGGTQNPEGLLLKTLVDRGLRAQIRSGNLLTGQLYVALDFHPDDSPKPFQANALGTYLIPTVPSTLDQLEPQVAQIVKRLNAIEIDKIGDDLTVTLKGLQATLKEGTAVMKSANRTLGTARGAMAKLSVEARQTLKSLQDTIDQMRRNLLASDAPVQRNLNESLKQLQRASQSLRALTDYLQRHPESLLRGKQADQPLE